MSTPKTTASSFTEREQQILATAWTCLDSGEVKIDYSKLAAKLGMSNPRSASNAWAAIKKKIIAMTESEAGGEKDTEGDASSAAPTPAKKGPVGRKRKARSEGEEVTPAKKKSSKSKKVAEATIDSEGEKDDKIKVEDAEDVNGQEDEEEVFI